MFINSQPSYVGVPLAILLCFIGIYIPRRCSTHCGIQIYLFDSENNYIVGCEQFQISNDPVSDSEKVKKSVDRYEKLATDFINRDKISEDFKKQKERESCDAYKNVIGKVMEKGKW